MCRFDFYMKYCLLMILFGLALASESQAASISYEDVLERAVINSYELSISDTDIEISRSTVKEVKSLYYPALSAQFNTEHAEDLTGGVSGFSAVGETLITDETRYQNSLSMNLSYNLFDFGSRSKRLFIAKKDLALKKLLHGQTLRELKLKITELYTEALIAFNGLRTNKEALTIYKELFTIKERLYKAGKIQKTDVAEEAIRVAKTLDEIDKLRISLQTALEDISFYTRESYDIDKLDMLALKDNMEEETHTVNLDETLEYRIYESEIEKKKAEIDVLRRELLPKFSLYSNYQLYGSDKNEWDDSMREIEERNFSVGVSAKMMLFDGFANSAQRQRLQHELKRLELNRDETIAKMINRQNKLREQEIFYKAGLINQQRLTSEIDNKLSMMKELTEQKVIDSTYMLNQKAELLLQKAELENMTISKISNIMKINILSEIYN